MKNTSDLMRDYPKLLKRYELLKEIPSGGRATVFLCRSRSSKKEFTCKTFSIEEAGEAQVEKEVMQKLSSCAGVLHLEEVIKDSRFIHLIMEHCHYSLASRIQKKGKLSQKESALLIQNLAKTIQLLHIHGIIHRNLKSHNILVAGKPYDVRVSDFYLSAFVFVFDPFLTDIVGTPRYMAPEVLQGFYSKEVDIWGLGLILYESLTGNIAFPGLEEDEIQTLLLNEGKGFVVEYLYWPADGSVPKEARDLVLAMLRPKPKDRIALHQILSHPWIIKHSSSQNKADHRSFISKILEAVALNAC